MLCYWCYWGWPKPLRDIYNHALKRLHGLADPLLFGPAHLVWEDENFDQAQWCLKHFNQKQYDYSTEQLQIVKESLQQVAKLPNYLKQPPDNFDDQHPENFPPPHHWLCKRETK